jgi:ribosomal protein S27AE
MEVFQVEGLPEIDQVALKRGLCPWCLVRIVEVDNKDACPECGDQFIGKLNFED